MCGNGIFKVNQSDVNGLNNVVIGKVCNRKPKGIIRLKHRLFCTLLYLIVNL